MRRLGFEAHVVTVQAHQELVAAVPDVSLVDAAELVETLRLVKDDGEMELIREACAIGTGRSPPVPASGPG